MTLSETLMVSDLAYEMFMHEEEFEALLEQVRTEEQQQEQQNNG